MHRAHTARRVGEPLLRVRDLWFRYAEADPWVVSGVSFDLNSGDTLRIPGVSGSGKTTLLRILGGCLAPARGEALIRGVDSRAARDLIAYLPQSAHCIQGTIRENLEMYSGGASWADIRDACQRTGLAGLIHRLPMGFETVLPPGGASLSGGERQLILLTGCVASGRPLVLLDEAFAHMDLEMRAGLLRQRLFEGRAVVYVDHEATVTAPADR